MTTVVSTESGLSVESPMLHFEPRRGNFRAAGKVWLIRLALLAVVLGSWQIVTITKVLDPTFVGEPSKIAVAFGKLFFTRVVTRDLPTTLNETIVGFIIGAVSGITVGFMLSRFQVVNQAVQPLLSAANSLPRVALAPLFIIWFGLGQPSKIALSVSLVFFILLANTMAGLTSADRDLLLLARSLGASEYQRLRLFVLPAAVPTLVAGLELGLVYSFLGAVTGEIIGGSHGLGVVLAYTANTFDTNKFFAVLLLLAIVTTVMTAALRLLGRRILRWHEIEMSGSGGEE